MAVRSLNLSQFHHKILNILLTSKFNMKSVRLSHLLVKNKAYINGQWVDAHSKQSFDVYNPADGSLIGNVPNMAVEDVENAIQSANESFKTWQKKPAKERSIFLRRWFELMITHKSELAKILTAEQGKPLKESEGEIMYAASFLEWFSEEARRINGEVIPSTSADKEILLIRRPLGVAAMITPWNFPSSMITRKVGAALASGCTCIVKPSEDTPYSALALAQLAHEAKIPPGVFNVVTSGADNSPAVGKVLCESPMVAGLSFTGSTAVGKILYKQCASTVKRLSLELGGNAPFIVFDSADVNAAVNGAIVSKFRNAGQTCVSANRILVQSGIHDKFVEKLAEVMQRQIKVGSGFEPEVTQGPLINKQQFTQVEDYVKDAMQKGAKVVLGGKPHSLGNLYFEPTLLTEIKENMRVCQEEIFGPVAVIIKFETEEQALALANSSRSGLAGYFYSNDISQIWRVAKELEVGMVGINEGLISTAEAAFGGIKESGFGREGSHHGIDEYTYVKYLCFGNLK